MSKAKSFATLKAEIAALEAQATEARRRELAEVVADIKSKIATYGLTPADLGLRGVAFVKTRGAAAKKGVGVPKYKDPKTGKTWTGHGRAPDWLAGAKDRTAFLIDASTASVSSPGAKKAATHTPVARKPARSLKQAMAKNVAKAAKPSTKAKPKKATAKKATIRQAAANAPAAAPEAAQA